MGTQYIDWDTSWTTTAIASSAITTGNGSGTDITAAISLDLKVACLVGVEAVYASGTVTGGIKVYILSDVHGTYEDELDFPARVYQMPGGSGATYNRTFAIPATDYDDFKVFIENDTGVTVTTTVDYKTAVVTTV